MEWLGAPGAACFASASLAAERAASAAEGPRLWAIAGMDAAAVESAPANPMSRVVEAVWATAIAAA
ncbi:MAG: hypothetical protein JOY89_11240 [Solirubrobacterales bacterium]|nr:hypothetical protein [Solirubrobacterales bacterium]